jgi:hypothetical protein
MRISLIALFVMRTYASFFEWRDKRRKELGVCEELVVALNGDAKLQLHSPREFSPDPPDCVCLNALGQTIAVEVAEVVCEKATRLNAMGSEVYRIWRPGELAKHIARELADKDRKIFNGGPYYSIIACLFTDEPALTVAQANLELEDQLFGPFEQISAAYLLFSYEPETQSYPIIALQLRA